MSFWNKFKSCWNEVKRKKLIESIVVTISDYRAGEIPQLTFDHVDKWIKQFNSNDEIRLLREIDHVLKATYLDKKWVSNWIDEQLINRKIVHGEPHEFWKSAYFLSIQKNGNSQVEMLNLFEERLRNKYGIAINNCINSEGIYVYIDDILFSGNRVATDIEAWVKESSPEMARVYIITIASYASGQKECEKRIMEVARVYNKQIQCFFYPGITLEKMAANNENDSVLGPSTSLKNKRKSVFSSKENQKYLKEVLFEAGTRIRNNCNNPSRYLTPLGYNSDTNGPGFGSMIVTYRNCPNNCPLAFWWGDPEADANHPFSKWYPLLRRKTYNR